MKKRLKGLLLKITSELEDGHHLVSLCRKAIQSANDSEMKQFVPLQKQSKKNRRNITINSVAAGTVFPL